jgi:hypothetical protein
MATNFTPEMAKLAVAIGATPVSGISDLTITDKTGEEDLTNDEDTAIRRGPTLDDGDLKFTMILSPTDDGQVAVLAAKLAHDTVVWTARKGSIQAVVSGFVSSINYSKSTPNYQRADVTVSVSGGMAVTIV